MLDTDRIEELAERLAEAEERAEQLQQALESRIVIEQAKGVLAERLGISVDDAFDLLRYAARSARTLIHELAARVVYESSTPGPVTLAIARRSRWRAALMREHNEAVRSRLDELAADVAEQLRRLAERPL